MVLEELVEEFLIYISAVRNLSENTVTGYKNDLEQLKRFLSPQIDVKAVTSESLRLCIGQLSREHKAAASVNRFIASMRSIFSYALKFGHVEHNPALDIKTVKLPKKVPRFMTQPEVNELCTEPEHNELLWGTRDSALFTMLYSSGCRVSEIANLCLADFTSDFHSAVVTGKGNKQRVVYFASEAREAIARYLPDRKKVMDLNGKTDSTDRFFINQKGEPLSVGGIHYIITRYSGPEGTNRHMNPHAFRHTFATTMIGNGADVRLVQEMLGHSSISTTQRYTHMTTEKLMEVYNKAHPHS